jgi:CRISPR-associated protein Cas5t
LGESWAMVNGIRRYRETDGSIRWLVRDKRGLIGLPVWIDRNTGQGTFKRFSLSEFDDNCWVEIPKLSIKESSKKRK